jgi:phosphatidylethanolamine/phosphatidyl-N-methylethanolamine N-methyltransferase
MALGDQFRFLKSLWERPAITGAVAPSGAALARAMASNVDPNDTLPVIELGPGTGVVTRALIERGVKPARIIAIEWSAEFCGLLRERFPGITVIRGDAYDLPGTLPKGRAERASAVVSSLPLPARTVEERQALVMNGLSRMTRGKPFIQFSYMRQSPVPLLAGGFTAETSRWIFRNIPPARVWLYRLA